MDNQDFDKIFSDGLEEELDFGFREEDWAEVAERIQPKSKRRVAWWKWLMLAMILCFGGVIYCLSSQLRDTRNEVSVLNQKISQQEITKRNIVAEQKQAIVLRDTINIIDTIIKTVVIEKAISEIAQYENIKPKYAINQSPNFLNTPTSEQDAFSSKEDSMSMESPVNLLSEVSLKSGELIAATKNNTFYQEEIHFPKKAKRIRNRLKIGLTNAWGVTEKVANDSLSNVYGDVKSRILFDLGVQAEWTFSPKIRALARIGFHQVQYNEKNSDGYNSIVDLANLNISQRAIHYQLGLKYIHWKGNKWTPFAGLTIDAQSTQSYTSKALIVTGYEEARTQKNKNKQPAFRLNSLTTSIGFEYRISKRFSWQIESWYQLNIWNPQAQFYGHYGLRNTVLYHF